MTTIVIHEESELRTFARGVLLPLTQKNTAHVLALTGDLGAGKTAFTKALALELGVEETVTSPTFMIMKIYAVSSHPFIRTLVHIDAYRIESIEELRVLGIEELFLNPQTLLCIEWPERIKEVIPEDSIPITIHIGEKEDRIITYGKQD